MEAADFRPTTGDAFNFPDHPLVDVILEGICRGVPESGQQSDNKDPGGDQNIFPPARSSGGTLLHRVCTPSAVGSGAPGTLSLLSERSECSQETINSLTFSSVRSSRIFAETSCSGTSPAPDCFNCGTNWSR